MRVGGGGGGVRGAGVPVPPSRLVLYLPFTQYEAGRG